jgi:hypothetical protein
MGEVLDAAARIRAQQGRPPPPGARRPEPPLQRAYVAPTPPAPNLQRIAAPIAPWKPPPPVLHSVTPPHVTTAGHAERARIRAAHSEHLSRSIEESNRIRNEHGQMVARANAESARIRAQHDRLIERANRERERFDRQLAEANAAPVTAALAPPTGESGLMDIHMPKVLEEALLIALEQSQDPAKLRELARGLVNRYPAAASIFNARASVIEQQPAAANGYY